MTEVEHVEALANSLGRARAVLSQLKPSGPRHYFLAAMAGYLYGAIAVGDTVLGVVRSQFGRGAGPLKRFLHESYLDVLFLASDPDPDLLAAKTVLSELKDSLRLLADYREVRAAHPDAGLPPVPPAWEYFDRPVEEMLRVLDDQNVNYGGSPDLFRRAWSSWDTGRYWHWSGLRRNQMINVLVTRGKLDGRGAFMAMSLTKIYNASAHPAPAWSELPFPEDTTSIDVPLTASNADLGQLALASSQFLDGISKEVAVCFQTVNAA